MSHVYSDAFYDYIEQGSRRSAQAFIEILKEHVTFESVLDVGCGRGAWLSEWEQAGLKTIAGLDGDYVERDKLHISPKKFTAVDLSRRFNLGKRFDLVQCLEVAEHLPATSAAGLVNSLAEHGDIIVFSAATPGQGGENHINEKPLGYWRGLFSAHAYEVYDPIRPALKDNDHIMPWYRYNTLVYANSAGRARFSADFKATHIPIDSPIPRGGDLSWKLRKAVVRQLPRPIVNWIASANAARTATKLKKAPQ
ncbi:MAG: methyltransferase domain-containing protein [Pseudomonadota bacterium]